MNLVVSKKDLLRAAGLASAVAERKGTLPALAMALLDARDGRCTVAGTDLFLAVANDVVVETKQPGSFAVPAKDLFDRAKQMPDGPVLLSSDDRLLTMKARGAARRYTLRGMPGEDYPPLPKPDPDAPTFALASGLLSTLIEHVHFAIATDETRAHLNSAFIQLEAGKIRMVSTDGHRLAKIERLIDGAANAEMLIPLKAVGELRRLDEELAKTDEKTLTLVQSGPTLFVVTSDTRFSVKLVDATFPPYAQVIPQACTHTLRVPRVPAMDALKAVSVAASERTGGVKLAISRGVLKLYSESHDGGEGLDEVPIDYDGPNLSVGVNAKYMLDVLGAMSCDEATWGLSDELDPILVRPVSSDTSTDYLAVVMPMRI